MSRQADIDAIRSRLKHHPLEAAPARWFDPGSPALSAVLGSESKGIPYGKIIELYGQNSHGKSMLALYLAAKAQEDGAAVIWLDFEGSFDSGWAIENGLEADDIYLLEPTIGRFGKKTGDVEIQGAESVFQEAKEIVKLIHERDGKPIFSVIDSVAAILINEEEAAGIEGQNMRTKLGPARFMSSLLRQWTPLCKVCDMSTVFINQIRMNPNAMFGNPEYTPGGESLGFYTSIRARVARVKGGRLMDGERCTGIRGKITNYKNKSGSGSVEGASCGYAMRFNHGTEGWMFCTPKEIQKDGIEKWQPDNQ